MLLVINIFIILIFMCYTESTISENSKFPTEEIRISFLRFWRKSPPHVYDMIEMSHYLTKIS